MEKVQKPCFKKNFQGQKNPRFAAVNYEIIIPCQGCTESKSLYVYKVYSAEDLSLAF